MSRIVKADVELREACRREIQQQVDRFLALGGSIEKVQQPVVTDKQHKKAWHEGYTGNYDAN